MTRTQVLTTIKLNNGYVANVDIRPHAYLVSWPTKSGDEDTFRSIRDFYEALRSDIGGDFKPINKLFQNSEIFDPRGIATQVPLEEFLSPEDFYRYLRRGKAVKARISSPYADVYYDMEGCYDGHPQAIGKRRVRVASHLDLTDGLSQLVKETHVRTFEPEELLAFKDSLRLVLGKY